MITLVDVKKAVNLKLKSHFGDTVPVIAQDVKKGFVRPSFTTEISEPKIETLESQIETSCTVKIYYFLDLKNLKKSISILDMKWQLPVLFGNTLNVADRAFNIIEPSANDVDDILVFEFDLLFYQGYVKEAEQVAELMKELHINLKGK